MKDILQLCLDGRVSIGSYQGEFKNLRLQISKRYILEWRRDCGNDLTDDSLVELRVLTG